MLTTYHGLKKLILVPFLPSRIVTCREINLKEVMILGMSNTSHVLGFTILSNYHNGLWQLVAEVVLMLLYHLSECQQSDLTHWKLDHETC